MRAQDAPPDEPAGVELLHHSDRVRVTRLLLHGRTVIRKELLGADVPQRRRHELGLLTRLQGACGVAQLAEAPQYRDSIVLVDVGGTSLATWAKPMPADVLVPLAVKLARAVAAMHRHGVLHRDLTPANVVVSADGEPCLIDFGLATSFAEIRPEFTPNSEVAGTLAYLAPEQTGRTGRSVDQRTDLYTLGATLYELATGEPPFGYGDPLQLTYDHLARVPVAPAKVHPAVPGALSDIIMHLLEKEPDSRYQTAEGLIHDLTQLTALRAGRFEGALRVGEHDVPQRLLPPARLIGRDAHAAVLTAAFEQARVGGCRGLLINGASGVGKTALVDELRPVVTSSDGWFAAGRFDQSRTDRDDAAYRMFRTLARLLLAEPEADVQKVREKILDAVRPNAGLLAAMMPDFAALIRVRPDPGDPLTANVRSQRVAVEVLRAIASPERPVVMFFDDLQWAGRLPLGILDLLLGAKIDGLFVVGAYQEGALDQAPLAAWLPHWRDREGVGQLRLDPLPVPERVTMLTEMLRVGRDAAAELAEVIGPYTSGNPSRILESLNALRRDCLLTPTPDGWRWDRAALQTHLDRSGVTDRLAARLDALPAPTRRLLEALACLGIRAELSLLQAAISEPGTGGPGVDASMNDLDVMLGPALDAGLLVIEPAVHHTVRFSRDRVREVVLRGLDPHRRRGLHLAMARRLATVPDLSFAAAEQYLPVVDGIDDPHERRRAAALLRQCADQASMIGDQALVSALLAAALTLIDPSETAVLVQVRTGRHVALTRMGRLDEADKEYRAIRELPATAVERGAATALQVRSLTHRTQFAAAIDLGLASLPDLGVTAPEPPEFRGELDRLFDTFYHWLDHSEDGDDGGEAQPSQLSAPAVGAIIDLIDATMPAAFFAGDLRTHGWLSLQALRLWRQHGYPARLSGSAASVGLAAVALRADYAAAYRAVGRILAVTEAGADEPCAALVRFHQAILACWFEPIENSVGQGRRAREGLIAAGDLANAGYSYHLTVACLLDCAPTLDDVLAELDAGLAFLRGTSSAQSLQWLDSYRWLADVLRGKNSPPVDEVTPADLYPDNPAAVLHGHINQAIAAAVLGDADGLLRDTAAAMSLLPAGPGFYTTAVAHLLRGLALAAAARATSGPERAEPLAELAEVVQWLADRAVDAPDNILHMLRLLEAEQAWAVGDFRTAVLAFDAARREADQRQRPWHRALILGRAARFHVEHGMERTAEDLLAQARRTYRA